jgi:hypothetical protein
MLEVLRLAAAVLSRLGASDPVGRMVARISAGVVLGLLAGLVVVGAISCATAALWIHLLPQAGRAGAPLVTAVVLLLLAAILAGAAYLVVRAKRRRNSAAGKAAGAAELGLAFDLAERARRAGLGLVREHKTTLLLAALIGGLVLGSGRDPPPSRRGRR